MRACHWERQVLALAVLVLILCWDCSCFGQSWMKRLILWRESSLSPVSSVPCCRFQALSWPPVPTHCVFERQPLNSGEWPLWRVGALWLFRQQLRKLRPWMLSLQRYPRHMHSPRLDDRWWIADAHMHPHTHWGILTLSFNCCRLSSFSMSLFIVVKCNTAFMLTFFLCNLEFYLWVYWRISNIYIILGSGKPGRMSQKIHCNVVKTEHIESSFPNNAFFLVEINYLYK